MPGVYEGRVAAVWLADGRNMQLTEVFAYVDAAGLRWQVPKNARVDGASIPRFLWTLTGGPFEGKYRDASVVHDWFCDVRTRPWRAVHRMFFEAMVTSGVGLQQARIMYAGVMIGGPRWSENAVSNAVLAEGRRVAETHRKAASASAKLRSKVMVVDIAASADRSASRAKLRDLAGSLGVSTTRAIRATKATKANSRKQAVHFRPSRAKVERVVQAAAELDLEAIDELVARETRGLKLTSAL